MITDSCFKVWNETIHQKDRSRASIKKVQHLYLLFEAMSISFEGLMYFNVVHVKILDLG